MSAGNESSCTNSPQGRVLSNLRHPYCNVTMVTEQIPYKASDGGYCITTRSISKGHWCYNSLVVTSRGYLFQNSTMNERKHCERTGQLWINCYMCASTHGSAKLCNFMYVQNTSPLVHNENKAYNQPDGARNLKMGSSVSWLSCVHPLFSSVAFMT